MDLLNLINFLCMGFSVICAIFTISIMFMNDETIEKLDDIFFKKI